MENSRRVRLDGVEAARDVLVEGADDGVLGHVLDPVRLRVRVRHVAVPGVVVEPVGPRRTGGSSLNAPRRSSEWPVSWMKTERSPLIRFEYCDGAVGVVGVAAVGWRSALRVSGWEIFFRGQLTPLLGVWGEERGGREVGRSCGAPIGACAPVRGRRDRSC